MPLHCLATVIPVRQARKANVLLVNLFPMSKMPVVLMQNALQNFFPGTLFLRKLVTAQKMNGKKTIPRRNSTMPVKTPGWSTVGSNAMVEVSEAAIDHVDVMVIVEKSYLWLSRSLVVIEMEKIEHHLI